VFDCIVLEKIDECRGVRIFLRGRLGISFGKLAFVLL
jgi:hypothetical protein